MAKDAVVISPAPDAERIARPLIERHHRHLLEARVLFLFTTQERKRKGKVVMATAQKLSDLDRYLASGEMRSVGDGADFLVLISWEVWRNLTAEQQAALIDHELSHCLVQEDENGAPVLKIRGHDVEEFAEIVQRHGLWEPDLEHFGQAVRQLPLFAPVGGRREAVAV